MTGMYVDRLMIEVCKWLVTGVDHPISMWRNQQDQGGAFDIRCGIFVGEKIRKEKDAFL